MPISIEDARRILREVLLRGPNDPERYGGPIQELYDKIRFSFDGRRGTPKVTGVGLTAEGGESRLVIFLEEELDGFAGVVREVLGLSAFDITERTSGPILPRARPAQGGDSLGEGRAGGESGTLGALVKNAAGQRFILTCNHVVGAVNQARPGDVVWQPSARDGGGARDCIGTVHQIHTIDLTGTGLNHMDAALIEPDNVGDVIDGVIVLGSINGTAPGIALQDPVRKYGWQTQRTDGHYMFKMDFLMPYAGHGTALFVDQLGIVDNVGIFGQGGDSGSVVLDAKDQLVGLYFGDAAAISMSFANPIEPILSHFGVSPV
ncbi:hypothetical protein SAMN04488105_11265 [Salipiger thiooxidans]|uniref:Trypsin-like peptidase domain-containing protein n=1 Tax=Salipiger thiooxidans TaxID=282683 RepID=A0A1G7I6P2_9RHOB|nr:hypothetical protein [Salipiger thiooxidans]SDF08332.1 hypothetical protein SAMN04488105_11265 [Salipiger thiooxidans]